MTIGEKIKEIRISKGLTQKELAKMSGISASAITLYENNQRIPSILAVVNIAIALGVYIDSLVDASSDKISTDYFFVKEKQYKDLQKFVSLFYDYMKLRNVSITEISDAKLMTLFANFLCDVIREPNKDITQGQFFFDTSTWTSISPYSSTTPSSEPDEQPPTPSDE